MKQLSFANLFLGLCVLATSFLYFDSMSHRLTQIEQHLAREESPELGSLRVLDSKYSDLVRKIDALAVGLEAWKSLVLAEVAPKTAPSQPEAPAEAVVKETIERTAGFFHSVSEMPEDTREKVAQKVTDPKKQLTKYYVGECGFSALLLDPPVTDPQLMSVANNSLQAAYEMLDSRRQYLLACESDSKFETFTSSQDAQDFANQRFGTNAVIKEVRAGVFGAFDLAPLFKRADYVYWKESFAAAKRVLNSTGTKVGVFDFEFVTE